MFRLPDTNGAFMKVSGSMLKPCQHENDVLNVGLFNEITQSLKQIAFLDGLKPRKIKPDHEEVGTMSTEKGASYIPNTKDFYMGGAL